MIHCQIFSNLQTGEFLESHVPTVFETSVEDMDLDGRKIKLTLWDTAGQESYERLRPLSYPKTDIFLIAFSLDK